MAPPGGDSIAVLLPVPNLRAPIDWARDGDRLRDALLADFETTFGLSGLEASIQVEHRMTPADFASELGAVDGNAFAVEPTLHQSAYFRAPTATAASPGLYHAGGGTHPAPASRGVLMGAQVTAGLVEEDLRRGRGPGARARSARPWRPRRPRSRSA